jgi:hypothetical protein
MSRWLGLSFLIGVCGACGGNADNGLFDPSANGGSADSGGSGGNSNASGGTNGKGGPTGGTGGSGSGGTNASAGTGSSSGGAASAGAASGGTGHAGTGGAAAGGTGNESCEELIDAAYDALSKARACDPSTDIPHCVGFIEDPCGCSVAIEQPESEAARVYAAALAQMEKRSCTIACLAIVCYEPVGNVCHENGSC